MSDRYARQLAFFGEDGHRRIATATIAAVGCGGLGMPLLQQLAYLGITDFIVADAKTVAENNLNRLVGALPGDIGAPKVAIAKRLITAIQPGARVLAVQAELPDPQVLEALARATLVFGAFDRETPRLQLTDWCSKAGVPYIDLASEVLPDGDHLVYGGRVVVAHDGTGCPRCLGLVDDAELARENLPAPLRPAHDDIYGIHRDALAGSGPSVVTINSVIASLAATEAMCLLTGLRPPARQLTYRADRGVVLRCDDTGDPDCPFCTRWRAPADERPRHQLPPLAPPEPAPIPKDEP